jgi:hypothetical protein
MLCGTFALVSTTVKRNFMLSGPLTLSEVSRFAEVQFPPVAVLEDNSFTGGLSRVLIARVRMPQSVVASFLTQSVFKNRVSTSQSTLRNGLAGDALEQMHKRNWWPDRAQNYRAVDTLLRNTDSPKSLNMVVSLDDPRDAVVYLYVNDG